MFQNDMMVGYDTMTFRKMDWHEGYPTYNEDRIEELNDILEGLYQELRDAEDNYELSDIDRKEEIDYIQERIDEVESEIEEEYER